MTLDDSSAREGAAARDLPLCDGCGGPCLFDTSVPNDLWNRVMRPLGEHDREYLCAACVLSAFAAAGVSFTAHLSGGEFHRLPITVEIHDGREHATQAAASASTASETQDPASAPRGPHGTGTLQAARGDVTRTSTAAGADGSQPRVEATLAARDAALQDARYEAKLFSENYTRDYEREKQRADAAERALSDTVQALEALDAELRSRSQNPTFAVESWGAFQMCADDLARLRASLAPQGDKP